MHAIVEELAALIEKHGWQRGFQAAITQAQSHSVHSINWDFHFGVPVGTVIHQAPVRVGRMCSWPILQAPDTASGVHMVVARPGSDLVLGHFSDTSPCLCSFCVRPALELTFPQRETDRS